MAFLGSFEPNLNEQFKTLIVGKFCFVEYIVENVCLIENECFNIECEFRLEYIAFTRKLNRRKQKTDSLVLQKSVKEFSKTCLICLHTFQTKNWYSVDQSRHEQVFDLTRSVVCPLCNITIQNKRLVTAHFEQEHGNQNITCCCECLEIIPKDNTDKLRRHILTVHHSASEAFVCPDCGKECSSKVQLEVHMAEIHNSGRTVAMCQHCGKSFGHLTKLKVHLKRHQPRDLQCPHCEKVRITC